MSEIRGRLGGTRDDDTGIDGPPTTEPDAGRARWLRRHVAGGVTAVTTVVEGEYRAATVGTCVVASTEPFLLLISIDLDSQMDEWLQTSGVFAVSVLPWRLQFLADRFAGFAPLASPHFEGIAHSTSRTGSPILTESIGWADCRIADSITTGDHRLFIGQVVAVGEGSSPADHPLIYYLNRYRRLD